LLFILQINVSAQSPLYNVSAWKAGISYQIGSPVHRIGLNLGFVRALEFVQINWTTHLFYAFKNYGPSQKRMEWQFSPGVSLAFGKERSYAQSIELLNSASNFTNRQYAIGYTLKYYYDKIGTTQTSAIVHARVGQVYLAMENDAFVFKAWDRYRTGTFSLAYEFEAESFDHNILRYHRIALNGTLYTGFTNHESKRRIKNSDYPARFGYQDISEAPYGFVSHGILSLVYEGSLLWRQNMHAQIGLDNERIRNALQNKLIHDMPFIPKKLIKVENPHVPMLQENGKPYLFKEGEKIRKGKFVGILGFNAPMFY